MEKLISGILGIIVGILLGLFIHNVSANTCSKSGEIKTVSKLNPSMIITTFEGKSDTLYIYKQK